LFQYCGERRAGVFGIYIDTSGENALMCDVSAAKIKAAFDGKMSSVFDLLRDQLAEDDLFGEILAADYDAVAMGAVDTSVIRIRSYHDREGHGFQPCRKAALNLWL
jgi:hypothetical protein